jgi:hypothetical protein
MLGYGAENECYSEAEKESDSGRSISYVLIILLSGIFCSGVCMAENLEYCYDHPLGKLDWSDNATLPKFDPSLGELTGIKIMMNFALIYNYSLSNLGDYASNSSIDVGGNLSMTLPDKTSLTIDAHGNKTIPLDSKENASSMESCNQSQSFDLGNLDWFIGSSPGEMVILPLIVNTQNSVQMGGEIKTEIKPRGAASICITYEFAPAEGVQINQSHVGGGDIS